MSTLAVTRKALVGFARNNERPLVKLLVRRPDLIPALRLLPTEADGYLTIEHVTPHKGGTLMTFTSVNMAAICDLIRVIEARNAARVAAAEALQPKPEAARWRPGGPVRRCT